MGASALYTYVKKIFKKENYLTLHYSNKIELNKNTLNERKNRNKVVKVIQFYSQMRKKI